MSGARWLIALALAVSVGACGNDTTQPGVGKAVVASLKGRLAGGEEAPRPTADQLRAAITPEFRAQSGNKPLLIVTSQRVPVSSILTMFAENGGGRTYLSPDQISFSLRNGVLVATRGLGDDLMSAEPVLAGRFVSIATWTGKTGSYWRASSATTIAARRVWSRKDAVARTTVSSTGTASAQVGES